MACAPVPSLVLIGYTCYPDPYPALLGSLGDTTIILNSTDMLHINPYLTPGGYKRPDIRSQASLTASLQTNSLTRVSIS